MIHFCCTACRCMTYRGGDAMPALYTILSGKEVRQTNQIESSLITVNGPITFILQMTIICPWKLIHPH